MLLSSLEVDPVSFSSRTGWTAKPEGLCQGNVCVPAPGAIRADGLIDVTVVADRLRMPLIHDPEHALWALGPASGGHALSSAVAPELTLTDWTTGTSWSLSSARGRKVIMIAWASW